MLSWFRSRELKDALNATKKVRVQGVNFTIRRIRPVDHLDGSKVLMKAYDVYENKKSDSKSMEITGQKVADMYRDIFMSGVVRPELSRKENDGTKVFVDELFNDWQMTEKLYFEIMKFTYGKKKIKSNIWQRPS